MAEVYGLLFSQNIGIWKEQAQTYLAYSPNLHVGKYPPPHDHMSASFSVLEDIEDNIVTKSHHIGGTAC